VLIAGVELSDAFAEAVGLPTKTANLGSLGRVLGRARWEAAGWGTAWPAARPRDLARLLVGEDPMIE
jgi:hypothetical protein